MLPMGALLAGKALSVKANSSEKHTTFAYFADSFDRRSGNFVYVNGKSEVILGRGVDVTYGFKIKPPEYNYAQGGSWKKQ